MTALGACGPKPRQSPGTTSRSTWRVVPTTPIRKETGAEFERQWVGPRAYPVTVKQPREKTAISDGIFACTLRGGDVRPAVAMLLCRGYTPMSYQTLDPKTQKAPDNKEGLNIGLEVPEGSALAAKPLHGPNNWPDPVRAPCNFQLNPAQACIAPSA